MADVVTTAAGAVVGIFFGRLRFGQRAACSGGLTRPVGPLRPLSRPCRRWVLCYTFHSYQSLVYLELAGLDRSTAIRWLVVPEVGIARIVGLSPMILGNAAMAGARGRRVIPASPPVRTVLAGGTMVSLVYCTCISPCVCTEHRGRMIGVQ